MTVSRTAGNNLYQPVFIVSRNLEGRDDHLAHRVPLRVLPTGRRNAGLLATCTDHARRPRIYEHRFSRYIKLVGRNRTRRYFTLNIPAGTSTDTRAWKNRRHDSNRVRKRQEMRHDPILHYGMAFNNRVRVIDRVTVESLRTLELTNQSKNGRRVYRVLQFGD